MTDRIAHGPPMGAAEEQRLAQIQGLAFGHGADTIAPWWEIAGKKQLRVQRENGRVDGGLILSRMGQWFGGQVVPSCGIAGVAVAPEARGSGIATRMMHDSVREQRELGFALSVLYASTRTLYRRAGYELAGHLFEYAADLDRLPLRDRELTVREITDADAPAIESCYRSVARRNHGWPERNDYLWTRVRKPRIGAATGWLVEADGAVEGYLYMVPIHDQEDYQHRLHLSDFQAATARAGRRLFTLLADHARMANTARWQGGPNDPVVELLPEYSYRMKVVEPWMLRILDVPRALESRGWPAGLAAELHLEIEDQVIPENHGRFVVTVANGAAKVAPGGEGRLRMHVRDLAPLYTGYHPPATLAALERLQAEPADQAAAAAVFAAPCPSMADMF